MSTIIHGNPRLIFGCPEVCPDLPTGWSYIKCAEDWLKAVCPDGGIYLIGTDGNAYEYRQHPHGDSGGSLKPGDCFVDLKNPVKLP